MQIRTLISDLASLFRPATVRLPIYPRSINGLTASAAFPIVAILICEPFAHRQKRAYSGDSGRELEIFDTFQSLAEVVCSKYPNEHGHSKLEEPEFHTHPDALPFDYVSDRTARHNYH